MILPENPIVFDSAKIKPTANLIRLLNVYFRL